jgi:5,10-methylenetetrahydromethanopterin reductase
MRAGFAHIPRFDVRDSVELVRQAEGWGYDTAWLPDQPLYRDPYVVLMAAAPATTRIRLGVGVTNPFSSHPVMTARLAGTLAEAVGPRFVLGMSTGNRREFVLPLGHRGDRGPERCRDAVRVIRELLAGGRTHYRSELFVADGTKLSFPTRGDIPIYLAGVGPRILEVAGEVADGIILNFTSAPGIAYGLEHVRRGAARAGRPPGTGPAGGREVIAWGLAIVAEDRAAAYDRIRPMIAHTMSPMAPATLSALGIADAQGQAIRESYWAHGPEKAAAHVTDRMIDHWAWIGPAEELAERFLALRAAGATSMAMVPWTTDLEETRAMGRLVAERVLPRLG